MFGMFEGEKQSSFVETLLFLMTLNFKTKNKNKTKGILYKLISKSR